LELSIGGVMMKAEMQLPIGERDRELIINVPVLKAKFKVIPIEKI